MRLSFIRKIDAFHYGIQAEFGSLLAEEQVVVGGWVPIER
jgi:hypothetical protein